MERVIRIDAGWKPDAVNPATGCPFDDEWAVFCLTDAADYQMFNGGLDNAYLLRVSKQYPHWGMAMGDYIGYQTSRGRRVLLSMSEADYAFACEVYAGQAYNERTLRPYEERVLVHSTTPSGWESIRRDGCLKSWNRLKDEHPDWEDKPIGASLGDPAEFSDYIMFAQGGLAGEIVVASREAGKIVMDVDAPYTPGARLYFDMARIAADGLLVRDGCHLKVKDCLPLEKYLLWACDWKSAGLDSPVTTPRQFVEAANLRYGKYVRAALK